MFFFFVAPFSFTTPGAGRKRCKQSKLVFFCCCGKTVAVCGTGRASRTNRRAKLTVRHKANGAVPNLRLISTVFKGFLFLHICGWSHVWVYKSWFVLSCISSFISFLNVLFFLVSDHTIPRRLNATRPNPRGLVFRFLFVCSWFKVRTI